MQSTAMGARLRAADRAATTASSSVRRVARSMTATSAALTAPAVFSSTHAGRNEAL